MRSQDNSACGRPAPRPLARAFPLNPGAPILGLSGFGRTMEINALVISGLDPGAIPGGSTKSSSGLSPGCLGPISIDRRLKGFAFSRYGSPRSTYFLTANDNFAQEYALAA